MLPQPFVTTAQTKSENIRVALDLTEEWDEIQAESDAPSTLVTGVVVGRTEFVAEHPEAVSAFLEHYRASVEYVNANVDEAAQLVGQYEIVAAEVAQKALPECNIVFIEGVEMKDSLSGYLSVLFEQNPKSVGGALPDDAFYYKMCIRDRMDVTANRTKEGSPLAQISATRSSAKQAAYKIRYFAAV